MNSLYAFIFIFCLCTPITLFIFNSGPTPIPIGENRTLARRPALFQATPTDFETYFSDHLPLRTQFTWGYLVTWEKHLHSWGRAVLRGKDGHYYQNLPATKTTSRYLGLNPLPRGFSDLLRVTLLGSQTFWEYQGIRYLSVYVPDKPTLYPEYLPGWVKFNSSWSDAIRPKLADSPLNYLDLTSILTTNKHLGLLYNKRFDLNHWNGLALSIAYEEIRQQLNLPQSHVQPYTLSPKPVDASFLGREIVPWLNLNRAHLKVSPNSYRSYDGRPAIDKIVNELLYVKNNVLLFLTDSYFNLTHQNGFPAALGKIFPLAHNVNIFLEGRYDKIAFSEVKKIVEQQHVTIIVEAFVERSVLGLVMNRSIPDYILIAGEQVSQNRFYPLKPDPTYQISNGTKIADLPLTIKANDDLQIILPSLTTNENGRLVLVAKIEAPEETVCQLYFAPEGLQFSERRSVRKRLHKGINYLHLSIYAKAHNKLKLRFDPGQKEGIYKIYDLPVMRKMFREILSDGI